jgi:hypothetical protein
MHVLQLLSLSDHGIISFPGLPIFVPSSFLNLFLFLSSVFRVTSFLCSFLLSIQLGQLFHQIFFSDFLASHFFLKYARELRIISL